MGNGPHSELLKYQGVLPEGMRVWGYEDMMNITHRQFNQYFPSMDYVSTFTVQQPKFSGN